jgi:hypothetical protein
MFFYVLPIYLCSVISVQKWYQCDPDIILRNVWVISATQNKCISSWLTPWQYYKFITHVPSSLLDYIQCTSYKKWIFMQVLQSTCLLHKSVAPPLEERKLNRNCASIRHRVIVTRCQVQLKFAAQRVVDTTFFRNIHPNPSNHFSRFYSLKVYVWVFSFTKAKKAGPGLRASHPHVRPGEGCPVHNQVLVQQQFGLYNWYITITN